jgi:hypothetical protein
VPTNRASVYFDPDQAVLIRRWLGDRGVTFHYPSPHVLYVKIRTGALVLVLPHDLITHVVGRDWAEIFSGDAGDAGQHVAPIPEQ